MLNDMMYRKMTKKNKQNKKKNTDEANKSSYSRIEITQIKPKDDRGNGSKKDSNIEVTILSEDDDIHENKKIKK